jgi:hypothetical protein
MLAENCFAWMFILQNNKRAALLPVDLTRRNAAALFGVRDILAYADPDIATDNVNGPIFEVSSQYNILTLPRTGDFFQHPMGVAVVADSEEVCDQALRLMKIEWEGQPPSSMEEPSWVWAGALPRCTSIALAPDWKNLNRMRRI